MSNFKNEMEKEFDKEKNYQAILSKIERVSEMKKIKLSHILVPAFALVAVLTIGIVAVNLENKPEDKKMIASEGIKVELNINQIKQMSQTRLDADIKTSDFENLPTKFDFIKNVKTPSSITLTNKYNIYVKSNKDIAKYDILHDYVFSYTNKNNTKDIQIAFSELEKPLRDYYIEDGEKESKIGETKVLISQYEDLYIATFEKQGTYFDIETKGITQQELVDLLTSVIE